MRWAVAIALLLAAGRPLPDKRYPLTEPQRVVARWDGGSPAHIVQWIGGACYAYRCLAPGEQCERVDCAGEPEWVR